MSDKLRQSVVWFAREMEIRLQDHDDRGRYGWRNGCSEEWLYKRLCQEVGELGEALMRGTNVHIKQECADVANFAHMIADLAYRGR